jgi:arabinoxylan arabinofuranohydrolase
MMRKRHLLTLSLALTIGDVGVCFADNPIVQTMYTADPAPMVHDGVLYAFLDHDEDGTYGWFRMKDWRLFSTTDMANWTDLGSPMSLTTFTWAKVDAWAGQVVYRDGKFYYFAPARLSGEPFGIGVGVSDKPQGPFVDAIGKPLVSGVGYIDPTVFVDDDGQVYLYWGNPRLSMVKLNADMISYSGDIVQIPMNASTVNDMYLEGPWVYKRNGLYYLLFSTQNNGNPGKEDIRYSTSPSPTGPWTYRGVVQAMQVGAKSWTNHSGVVEYKGNSYFFYHNGDLPGGSDFTRSTCVEQFSYNTDGTIPTIPMTKEGPSQLGHLNPFRRTEAETIAFSSGLKTEPCTDEGGGVDVTSIDDGDYIKVKGVDFGSGATSFDARIATGAARATIQVVLDSLTGASIGTCALQSTGGDGTWGTRSCSVTGATGVHDLFFKFSGTGGSPLLRFNWWQFSGPGASDQPPSDAGVADGASGDGGTGGRDGGAVRGDASSASEGGSSPDHGSDSGDPTGPGCRIGARRGDGLAVIAGALLAAFTVRRRRRRAGGTTARRGIVEMRARGPTRPTPPS